MSAAKKTRAIDLTNQRDLATLREGVTAALGAIAAIHGLKVRLGNGSYERDGTGIRFARVEFYRDGCSAEEKAWERNAMHNGLAAVSLGDLFMVRGEEYKITGWRPRARKNPIITENTKEGGTYFWSVRAVVHASKYREPRAMIREGE